MCIDELFASTCTMSDKVYSITVKIPQIKRVAKNNPASFFIFTCVCNLRILSYLQWCHCDDLQFNGSLVLQRCNGRHQRFNYIDSLSLSFGEHLLSFRITVFLFLKNVFAFFEYIYIYLANYQNQCAFFSVFGSSNVLNVNPTKIKS